MGDRIRHPAGKNYFVVPRAAATQAFAVASIGFVLPVASHAFILPFFDVYLLGGVNTGTTEFDLIIDPNFVLPEGAEEHLKEDYVGGFVGGGATLPLGWKELFWMADGNYTWARADSVDSTIGAATFSTRVGWRRAFDNYALSLWAGTMFMHYTQTLDISVDLLVTEIIMEMDIKSSDPWNMLLGGSFDIGENWQLMVEGGFTF